MATIKAVTSKAPLSHVINYIVKSEKTDSKICENFNCATDDPIQDMNDTKHLWDKTGGRQYYHFVQSFAAGENITPEKAHELASDLARQFWGEDYEYVVATHTDRDHIHSHIVVNSVSMETGKKFNNTRSVLQGMKDYSDYLCRENNLSVTVKGKHFDGTDIVRSEITSGNTEMYREAVKEDGWLPAIYEVVLAASRRSSDREEFIDNCETHGISVKWEENRKYITFSDDEGHKVRDKKLGETFNIDFSKSGFEQMFAQNIEKERAIEQVIEEAPIEAPEYKVEAKHIVLPTLEKVAVEEIGESDMKAPTKIVEVPPVQELIPRIKELLDEPCEASTTFDEAYQEKMQEKGLIATITEKIENIALKIQNITEKVREYINGRIEAISSCIGAAKSLIASCWEGIERNGQAVKSCDEAIDRGIREIKHREPEIKQTESEIERREQEAPGISKEANFVIGRINLIKNEREEDYDAPWYDYGSVTNLAQIEDDIYMVRAVHGLHILELQSFTTLEKSYAIDYGGSDFIRDREEILDTIFEHGLALDEDKLGRPILVKGTGDRVDIKITMDLVDKFLEEPEMDGPDISDGWGMSL